MESMTVGSRRGAIAPARRRKDADAATRKATRVAVYTDYPYQEVDGRVYAERAFAMFLARLAPHFDGFSVIGRLAPYSDRDRYPLGDEVDLVPLPYYRSLSEPIPVLKALLGSVRQYWKAIAEVDCVWLLGPHPLAFLFAALARLRGKRVVLGVRQDFPEYVRHRHPNRRIAALAAKAFDGAFRALGRLCGVIAVGPGIANNYRRSRRMLELTVSLVRRKDIVDPQQEPFERAGELKLLSVGRLEPEKNPLLLADVLARLTEEDPRWRLVVCGEGSLADPLRDRLRELGLEGKAELRGYVAQDDGLKDLYSECQMLLHVSWTEGLPQVLYEAFAAGLPVVATDVGGIGEAAEGAVSPIPPGDPAAAANAVRELRSSRSLRRERTRNGHALVSGATIDQECERVAEFLAAH